MKLKEISKMPTSIDDVHESMYRSYQLLEYVLMMIEAGDSFGTIHDLVEFIRSMPVEQTLINKEGKCFTAGIDKPPNFIIDKDSILGKALTEI